MENTKHKHYQTAYQAYCGTSFSPEKRAEMECGYYDAIIEEFTGLIKCPEVLASTSAKFERLFLASLSAKGRCLSPMITGPANFPTRRNEKANNAERKRSDELFAFVERVRNASKPKIKTCISSDESDAIEQLKEKLAKLEKAQNTMKAFNKAARKKGATTASIKAAMPDMSENVIKKLMQPSCFGTLGFESFELTNNNARIKNTKQRIEELEKAAQRETKEHMINGVKAVENVEENRIQLFFDGKPEAAMITTLKGRGFKWSPSRGCWQRMLNNNGIYAAKQVLKTVKESEAA